MDDPWYKFLRKQRARSDQWVFERRELVKHFVLRTMAVLKTRGEPIGWSEFRKTAPWLSIKLYFSEDGLKAFREIWLEVEKEIKEAKADDNS